MAHEPSAPAPSRPLPARLRRWVTRETTGGALLLGAALVALVWANSPWSAAYEALAGTVVGPHALHLDLSLRTWAADGLLAIFFFVVGLELKHEFVAGGLRNPREAGVPVLAAVGGMALPAAIYLVVVHLLGDPGASAGWAVPTATDIAFALAVLAVFGRGLPTAVRTFLLTLAVVDDLLAIVVIAVAYTAALNWAFLGLGLVGVALFGLLVRDRRPRWWLLVPVAVTAWALVHASGVHATVAGVLLGFTVPARPVHGEREARTVRGGYVVGPVSVGIALPLFAFLAAGVSVTGGVAGLLEQPTAIAIVVALVVGKLGGILGVTALVTRWTPLRLAPGIGLRDLLPIGFLAGIGFTVALLIAELSFADPEQTNAAKAAVLFASFVAAGLGAATLRWDARRARSVDMNRDGVPDDVTSFVGDDER